MHKVLLEENVIQTRTTTSYTLLNYSDKGAAQMKRELQYNLAQTNDTSFNLIQYGEGSCVFSPLSSKRIINILGRGTAQTKGFAIQFNINE